MPQKTPQEILNEMKTAYEEFTSKLNELQSKHKAFAEEALKKVENRKIQDLLNKIKT